MHTLHIRHKGVKPDGAIGNDKESGRRVSTVDGWAGVGHDAATGWHLSLAAPRDKYGNMDVNVAHFDSKKELEAWLRKGIEELNPGREVRLARK